MECYNNWCIDIIASTQDSAPEMIAVGSKALDEAFSAELLEADADYEFT